MKPLGGKVMKNISTKQSQLVTRIAYLIPLLLVYTIGVCITHVRSSESEVSLANFDNVKRTVQPAHTVAAKPGKLDTAEEIESIHDILRRTAAIDAARSLHATRKSVLAELQINNVTPMYAIERDYSNQQQIAHEDGEKSLAATRKVVLATLKDNVNGLFHDQFQYLGEPNPDEKQIAETGSQERRLPDNAAFKIADKSQ